MENTNIIGETWNKRGMPEELRRKLVTGSEAYHMFEETAASVPSKEAFGISAEYRPMFCPQFS